MPIPPTGGQYVTLPVGRHPATLNEVCETFVEQAPFRPRRELIFRALTLYIDLVSAEFSTCRYWIDGGFVTHKPWEPPEDADVRVVVPQAEAPDVVLRIKRVDHVVIIDESRSSRKRIDARLRCHTNG